MELDNASESLTNSSQIGPAPVAPCPGTTMSIIDKLADRNRRKKNIVYNLPESSGSSKKSNSDACAALCSSVYNSSFAVTKSIRLGKKAPDKHRPLLLYLQKEEDKFELLSRSFLLFRSESYKNVYLAPDRTKFEREKHKKLMTELRFRRSQGETSLVTRNGVIVTKATARNNPETQTTPPVTDQHS